MSLTSLFSLSTHLQGKDWHVLDFPFYWPHIVACCNATSSLTTERHHTASAELTASNDSGSTPAISTFSVSPHSSVVVTVDREVNIAVVTLPYLTDQVSFLLTDSVTFVNNQRVNMLQTTSHCFCVPQRSFLRFRMKKCYVTRKTASVVVCFTAREHFLVAITPVRYTHSDVCAARSTTLDSLALPICFPLLKRLKGDLRRNGSGVDAGTRPRL